MVESLFGTRRTAAALETLANQARAQRDRLGDQRPAGERAAWREDEDTTVELNQTAILAGAAWNALPPRAALPAPNPLSLDMGSAPTIAGSDRAQARLPPQGPGIEGLWFSMAPGAPASSAAHAGADPEGGELDEHAPAPPRAHRARRVASLAVTFRVGLVVGGVAREQSRTSLAPRIARVAKWIGLPAVMGPRAVAAEAAPAAAPVVAAAPAISTPPAPRPAQPVLEQLPAPAAAVSAERAPADESATTAPAPSRADRKRIVKLRGLVVTLPAHDQR